MRRHLIGCLGIFISDSYKPQIPRLSWVHFLTLPISVMVITAVAGHLITHKWERTGIRGEWKYNDVSHWVSPVFKHKTCQGWGPGASKTATTHFLYLLKPMNSTWVGRPSSWGHHFSKEGSCLHQLSMAATEGAAAKEEEEGKSSSVEKQFMLGSKGGQSPDLWREARMNVRDRRCMLLIHFDAPSWLIFLRRHQNFPLQASMAKRNHPFSLQCKSHYNTWMKNTIKIVTSSLSSLGNGLLYKGAKCPAILLLLQ